MEGQVQVQSVCVCVCVCERERQTDRQTERENCIADRCRDYGSGHASWYRINPRNILRLRPQQRVGTAAVRPVTIVRCRGCNNGISYSRHKGLATTYFPNSNVDICTGSWFLLHDNAPVHRSVAVQEFLARKLVCVPHHPPYSPDLYPCDYFLFPELKLPLKGRLCEDAQDIQPAVSSSLRAIP